MKFSYTILCLSNCEGLVAIEISVLYMFIFIVSLYLFYYELNDITGQLGR